MKTVMAIEKREDVQVNTEEPPLHIFIRNEKGELLKSFYWWRTETELLELIRKIETISITSPHHSTSLSVLEERK